MAQEAQTVKDGLSEKASDEQRVDNCRVPIERRGTMPRLDCPEELPPPTPSAEVVAAPTAPGAR